MLNKLTTTTLTLFAFFMLIAQGVSAQTLQEQPLSKENIEPALQSLTQYSLRIDDVKYKKLVQRYVYNRLIAYQLKKRVLASNNINNKHDVVESIDALIEQIELDGLTVNTFINTEYKSRIKQFLHSREILEILIREGRGIQSIIINQIGKNNG